MALSTKCLCSVCRRVSKIPEYCVVNVFYFRTKQNLTHNRMQESDVICCYNNMLSLLSNKYRTTQYAKVSRVVHTIRFPACRLGELWQVILSQFTRRVKGLIGKMQKKL